MGVHARPGPGAPPWKIGFGWVYNYHGKNTLFVPDQTTLSGLAAVPYPDRDRNLSLVDVGITMFLKS